MHIDVIFLEHSVKIAETLSEKKIEKNCYDRWYTIFFNVR